MGLAFTNFSGEYGISGVYPSASFNRNETVRFNFGSTPFKHTPPLGYRPYIEAVQAKQQVVDTFKPFLTFGISSAGSSFPEEVSPASENGFEEIVPPQNSSAFC